MRWIFVVAASLAVSACGQNIPTELAPDVIYHSGHVVTVDEPFTIADAFAVKDDRFFAVGTNAEVEALAGADTQRVDLQGRTVIPGLMDNHQHMSWRARYMHRGIPMADVPSLEEMLNRIRQGVAEASPGEVVFASGGWYPRDFAEGRGPTRQDLDEAVPNNPLMMFTRGRNNAHLNSVALAQLGIDRTTLDWGSFPILRDDETGEPNGYLSGGEQVVTADWRLLPQPTIEEQIQFLETEQAIQHALGFTGIRELVLPVGEAFGMKTYSEMNQQRRLTMRVSMGLMFGIQHVDGWNERQMDEMMSDLPPFPGLGDDMLQFDGTAAEFEVTTQRVSTWNRTPYPADSDNIGLSIARWPHSPLLNVVRDDEGRFYGIHRLPTEMFHDVVKRMNRHGYRPAFHISGSAALDWHLDAYEAADAELSIAGKRWVAEHRAGDDEGQMDRLIKLDMVVSLQRQMGPLRAQLDRGVRISLGSDFPAFDSNPFPIMSLHVTRVNFNGELVDPEQAITREEVLRLYTINNAYLMFKEDKAGSIESGKLADFVILSDDILSVPDEQIKELYPLATYVGGRQVYAREGGGF
jgi:hypothetical protein